MGETNWTLFGADAAAIRRAATAGFTPPPANATNNFLFGFNSVTTLTDAVGLYINTSGGNTKFAPLLDDDSLATGCSVRCAVKRAVSPSATGFSAGLFANLQAATKNDYGYILGLTDNNPHNIVLAKCTLLSGLSPTAAFILKTSSASFNPDVWHHLRLDTIANPNGDTVVKVFRNDLDVNMVDDPTWEAIPGMTDFIDDALGIGAANTGSTSPLAGGYAGAFFQCTKANSRAFFDHLEVARAK